MAPRFFVPRSLIIFFLSFGNSLEVSDGFVLLFHAHSSPLFRSEETGTRLLATQKRSTLRRMPNLKDFAKEDFVEVLPYPIENTNTKRSTEEEEEAEPKQPPIRAKLVVDEDPSIIDYMKPKAPGAGRRRWENLDPKIRNELILVGQEKAIRERRKREPKRIKRRRDEILMEKYAMEEFLESLVPRQFPREQRIPMTCFFPGMELSGTVISLVPHGAFVDVGTTKDCLLHISQITRDTFVTHPKEVFSPGDEVKAKVLHVDPRLQKMGLTMLDMQDIESTDVEGRVSLEELQVDDEMWGEVKRVTEYGAYVDVMANVHAWLHFMDHPMFDPGKDAFSLFKKGQKVRVWVSKLELDRNRVQVTAIRPDDLPGPRLEL